MISILFYLETCQCDRGKICVSDPLLIGQFFLVILISFYAKTHAGKYWFVKNCKRSAQYVIKSLVLYEMDFSFHNVKLFLSYIVSSSHLTLKFASNALKFERCSFFGSLPNPSYNTLGHVMWVVYPKMRISPRFLIPRFLFWKRAKLIVCCCCCCRQRRRLRLGGATRS